MTTRFSFKELARNLDDFSTVQKSAPSLVNPVRANAHKSHDSELQEIFQKRRKRCPNALLFREQNGAGSWVWKLRPCDRWICEECYAWRLETELLPEIEAGLRWAAEEGQTLKFLTLPYQSEDAGAQPTAKGRERRRKDLAHFKQGLKRLGYPMEYLKLVEPHKSGKIHMHFLAMMPYVQQQVLSDLWRRCTRGTSSVVDIEAVGMKCPRCYPGKKATRAEKRRSMIVPPPGRGECANCGYAPPWVDVALGDVARTTAQEIAKYLSKALDEAPDKAQVKKLTRSKAWAEHCQVKKEVAEPEVCGTCETVHKLTFIGTVGRLKADGYGGVEDIIADEPVVYHVEGREPVNCWGDRAVILESNASGLHEAIQDLRGPSAAELAEMLNLRE